MKLNKIKGRLITLTTFICIIIIWYLVSLRVNHLFVPNPLDVLNNGITLLKTGQLQIALWYTFKRILIATCISGSISLVFGFLIYNFKFIRNTINPVINLLRYIPVTAFYPLLIMWLGIDEQMKIAFYVIVTLVYMMPSVVLALEEINTDLIETGYTLGMSKLQTIIMIQLPATLPSILNSFVMMFGIGFTYCAVCETINAKYGVGYMISQSTSRGRTDLVFLGIITIMIVSFVFDNISKYTIRKIFKWRYLNDSVE